MSLIEIAQAAELNSSSVTSASSVENWLDDQPHPTDYEPVADVAAARSDKKRQRRPHRYSTRQSKHQKLSEIPVNVMSTSDPRLTRGAAAKSQKSPAKKPSKSGERVPSTPKGRRRGNNDDDDEPTPRAPADPFGSKSSIPDLSRDDQRSSHTSSTSSAINPGSSASRSRSPTKEDYDLKLTDIPVRWKTIGPSFPSQVKGLFQDLKRIERKIGIMPRAIRHMFIQGEAVDEVDVAHWFSSSDSAQDLSVKSGSWSHEEFFITAQRIIEAATRCRDDGSSEPEWNSAVHYRVFNTALESSWLPKGIWFHDVSTARIKDSSLLPAIKSKSKIMQSRMVDYAMVMRPSEELRSHIRYKLRQDGIYSINHTDAEYVRFSPIALSVETKRAAIEEDKANSQLETWVSAHFEKLRRLIDGDSDLPVLPLIFISGDNWYLMLAEMTETPSAEKEIVIHSRVPLGDTLSIEGVYQLWASIQRLAKWIDEEYRSWFERRVLHLE